MSQENEGFNIIAMSEPFQARTFRDRLQVLYDDRYHRLLTCQDWADYQRKRGALEGLKLALELCEDLVNEKERR